ncbi:MAG: helix-turn-helix domain-containing protein [Candidatus Omnitrophica bacterium]|nr:helix-turn-helix domain-containing protein [Candidatus Omnitrophota bacterium]
MYIKNLIKLRKKNRLTQEGLARKANISYHTLIKIESGGIENPKIETLIKLSDALEVTIDELIGRSKERGI